MCVKLILDIFRNEKNYTRAGTRNKSKNVKIEEKNVWKATLYFMFLKWVMMDFMLGGIE
jgi:hypothetical protein